MTWVRRIIRIHSTVSSRIRSELVGPRWKFLWRWACLNGRAIEPLQLAQLCQRARSASSSVCPAALWTSTSPCFGQGRLRPRNRLPQPDARSGSRFRRGVEIFAVNSMVKHDLAHSAYRERTEQCAAAVEAIRARANPEVRSLRDVDMAMLATTVAPRYHRAGARGTS